MADVALQARKLDSQHFLPLKLKVLHNNRMSALFKPDPAVGSAGRMNAVIVDDLLSLMSNGSRHLNSTRIHTHPLLQSAHSQ